jgi:hypothetical protein
VTTPPFPWWPYWIALVVIFLGAMAPIGITLYAANAAQDLGCTVTDGRLDPCLVDGVDKAAELQAMAGSFIYALITWPAGILLACLWLGILWLHRKRWSRKAGFDE